MGGFVNSCSVHDGIKDATIAVIASQQLLSRGGGRGLKRKRSDVIRSREGSRKRIKLMVGGENVENILRRGGRGTKRKRYDDDNDCDVIGSCEGPWKRIKLTTGGENVEDLKREGRGTKRKTCDDDEDDCDVFGPVKRIKLTTAGKNDAGVKRVVNDKKWKRCADDVDNHDVTSSGRALAVRELGSESSLRPPTKTETFEFTDRENGDFSRWLRQRYAMFSRWQPSWISVWRGQPKVPHVYHTYQALYACSTACRPEIGDGSERFTVTTVTK